MKEKNEIKQVKERVLKWIKEHKKELILAGIGVTSFIGILMGIKHKEDIAAMWDELKEKVQKLSTTAGKEPVIEIESTRNVDAIKDVRVYTKPQEPQEVSRHLRMLQEGMHHSSQKAAEAEALGISLLPNQTIVDSHTRYAA